MAFLVLVFRSLLQALVRIKSAPCTLSPLAFSYPPSTLILTCKGSSITHFLVFCIATHALLQGLVSTLYRDPKPLHGYDANRDNVLSSYWEFYCNVRVAYAQLHYHNDIHNIKGTYWIKNLEVVCTMSEVLSFWSLYLHLLWKEFHLYFLWHLKSENKQFTPWCRSNNTYI